MKVTKIVFYTSTSSASARYSPVELLSISFCLEDARQYSVIAMGRVIDNGLSMRILPESHGRSLLSLYVFYRTMNGNDEGVGCIQTILHVERKTCMYADLVASRFFLKPWLNAAGTLPNYFISFLKTFDSPQ